jgi:hypothetical protein
MMHQPQYAQPQQAQYGQPGMQAPMLQQGMGVHYQGQAGGSDTPHFLCRRD